MSKFDEFFSGICTCMGKYDIFSSWMGEHILGQVVDSSEKNQYCLSLIDHLLNVLICILLLSLRHCL
jgi:hypothetical protein